MNKSRTFSIEMYSRAQRRIITEEHPLKQVIAAAGSGKTRTVIGLVEYRLRHGLERPGRVLLLSFSRKAAGEIRERLPEELRAGVEVSTFHSFCFRHLLRLDPEWRARPPRLLEDAHKEEFLYSKLKSFRDELGGIPFALLLRDETLFRREFPEVAFAVYRSLHVYKRETGRVEYEDMITRMLAGLEEHAPHLEDLRRAYDLIIVDEFQDTDPRQLRFLESMNPPRLVVVGDDWQAIYGFRGATVQPFLDFARIFRGTRKYRLEENYRSTTQIVRAGNRAIRVSSRQLRKRVVAVRGSLPRLPVLMLETADRGEKDIVRALKSAGPDVDFRILVRSNFRREIWIRAGVDPERVLTIHKSKGLEFPVVLVDVIGGWSGAIQNDSESGIPDEELRVLYVGLSRAENLLIVARKHDYTERELEGRLLEHALSGRPRRVRPNTIATYLQRAAEIRKKS